MFILLSLIFLQYIEIEINCVVQIQEKLEHVMRIL